MAGPPASSAVDARPLQPPCRGFSWAISRPFVLGNGRAAILVNGRRISDSTFDLDTLPISAVERVEILSDTAAALHGWHAIGGAINIVLRRGFEGIEVQTKAGMTK